VKMEILEVSGGIFVVAIVDVLSIIELCSTIDPPQF
jgi:hypothetical protein